MNANIKPTVEIELQRKNVAAAKSLLKEAKEQATWAKCRRKLAKLLARRAQKGLKQAKENLAAAEAVLAQAEDIVCGGSNGRANKPKHSNPKPVARSMSKSTQRRRGTLRKRRIPATSTIAGEAEMSSTEDAFVGTEANPIAEQ